VVRREHSNSSHFMDHRTVDYNRVLYSLNHSKMFALFAMRLWKKSMRKSETVLMELPGTVSE